MSESDTAEPIPKDAPEKQRRRRSLLAYLPIHPDVREGQDEALREKRNLVSSVFIAMLIGLAYQEMIAPVRESIRAEGVTLGTVSLFVVFFLTSIRFFIGNQLHLLSKPLVQMRGDVWFYDFAIITFQSILLTFLGGAACVQVCRVARVDFLDILFVLFAIDIAWVASQWMLGKIFSSWHRDFIPWAWAALNSILVICMLILKLALADIYSPAGLLWLAILHAFAFVADIVLVDHYNLI